MSSKNSNWHSRRYMSSDRHDTARATWDVRKEEKKRSALERQEVASKRTPQKQLERLDTMFGKDKEAVKERAKLQKKMDKG